MQAVQDSATAELGPGYRKRMMSMSGLEGNLERVRAKAHHLSDSCEGHRGAIVQRERLLKLETGVVHANGHLKEIYRRLPAASRLLYSLITNSLRGNAKV